MKKTDKKHIKILLVEDNPDHAQLIMDMLDDARIILPDTEHVRTISAAQERLAGHDIEIILLDLSLPDSRGTDTFLKINDRAPGIPIVVLSALDDEGVAVETVQAGAQDYLVKSQIDDHLLERSICYAIERNRMMMELHRLQRDWENIFQSIGNPMLILDTKHTILAANKAIEDLLGKPEQDILGEKCHETFHQSDQPHQQCPAERVLATGNRELSEIEIDSIDKIFLICCTPLFNEKGDIDKIIHIYTDITERKRAEERLEFKATHDSLSGLFNRRHFMEQLAAIIKSAKRYGHPLSVCLCDLDEFKPVNDTYGHRQGDDVISAFGKVVLRELRTEDIPGRYGGDEFGIIFPHISAEEAMISTERVRRRFKKLVFGEEKGKEFSISATFGIVDFDPEQANVQDILKSADQVLYEGKKAGGNRVVTTGEKTNK